jgi:methyl-branched lipid omega-hydroxylase
MPEMTGTASMDQVSLDGLDLMDPAWFADGPPHELFARLRAEAPVHWNRSPDGSGFWSLTRHADVSAVARDTDTFSSYRGGIFLHPDQVTPLDLNRNLLLYKDPPEHTKYRKILQNAFTPRTVASLDDSVRARITSVIDAVIQQGECDFVTDIAVPVPLGVLAELMGIPDEDIPRLYEWTEQIEAAQRSPQPAAALETFTEMAAYLHEQIQIQLEAGGQSLVTRLRDAEVDGERLDEPEILTFFGLLVFAGNDTTRNTASSGTLALLEHPDQYARLCENPELVPQAVEEILRFTSVVNYFARTVTRDTEIGDQRLAQGDKVVSWYTSASRDEAVHDDPNGFDITRDGQDHKAFGGGGRHFCLGAGLARLELRILFEEVTRRMPDLAPAGEVKRVPSSWANSLTSMPVSFTPAAPQGR